MISWLHLLWIVPVVFSLGFATAAILSAAGRSDAWTEGYQAGTKDEHKLWLNAQRHKKEAGA